MITPRSPDSDDATRAEILVAGGDPCDGAEEYSDSTGIVLAVNNFAWYADRQVVIAIAIEISDCECGTEPIVALDGALYTRTVLMPDLMPSRRKTGGRSVQDGDGTSVLDQS